MSDIPERPTKHLKLVKPTLEQSPQFSTECADGFVYSVDREVTSLTFYIEREKWNMNEEDKPTVAGISREHLIELRLPTSAVEILAKHILSAIDVARKDQKYPRVGPLPR